MRTEAEIREDGFEWQNMNEEWKDANWTQGVFQVSNYGRVYNTKTKRFLKGSKYPKTGYIQIDLCYNGTRQKWELHRLVATVWQRPLLETEDAHHKNKFKWCNCCWNIQIKDSKKHAQEHAKERAVTLKMSLVSLVGLSMKSLLMT